VFVIMRQSRRSFVERVDFRTSPGRSANRAGWIGEGPTVVVTDLGVYRFDEADGEMYLASLHPGVTPRDVRDATGWDLRIPDDVGSTGPPNGEELRLVREELDPDGMYSR
jgi:glutaconate CoA-transferase subunit B